MKQKRKFGLRGEKNDDAVGARWELSLKSGE